MYTVTQETMSRRDGSYSETKRVVVRSRIRAQAVAKRWVGSVTRMGGRLEVYAYVDGIAVLPHIVPSVGELGYW